MKKTVRELAFRAIDVRKTKRQYIVWLENEIKKLSVSQYNIDDTRSFFLFESSNQKTCVKKKSTPSHCNSLAAS